MCSQQGSLQACIDERSDELRERHCEAGRKQSCGLFSVSLPESCACRASLQGCWRKHARSAAREVVSARNSFYERLLKSRFDITI